MTDATLPHVVLAREMVADVQADFPYALLRRAQVAALPALPADNFVEAPSYLVDLGLRRWRDPATLFAGGLARNPRLARRWEELKAGQEPALVMLARAWETGQCSTAAVNAGL
ncbi:MAG: hypothetical protein LBT54_04060, partial [Bifidobacteriaceae bacterium]|nr:hypothetical protein [Bifidobacteriaceae bacterium]